MGKVMPFVSTLRQGHRLSCDGRQSLVVLDRKDLMNQDPTIALCPNQLTHPPLDFIEPEKPSRTRRCKSSVTKRLDSTQTVQT